MFKKKNGNRNRQTYQGERFQSNQYPRTQFRGQDRGSYANQLRSYDGQQRRYDDYVHPELRDRQGQMYDPRQGHQFRQSRFEMSPRGQRFEGGRPMERGGYIEYHQEWTAVEEMELGMAAAHGRYPEEVVPYDRRNGTAAVRFQDDGGYDRAAYAIDRRSGTTGDRGRYPEATHERDRGVSYNDDRRNGSAAERYQDDSYDRAAYAIDRRSGTTGDRGRYPEATHERDRGISYNNYRRNGSAAEQFQNEDDYDRAAYPIDRRSGTTGDRGCYPEATHERDRGVSYNDDRRNGSAAERFQDDGYDRAAYAIDRRSGTTGDRGRYPEATHERDRGISYNNDRREEVVPYDRRNGTAAVRFQDDEGYDRAAYAIDRRSGTTDGRGRLAPSNQNGDEATSLEQTRPKPDPKRYQNASTTTRGQNFNSQRNSDDAIQSLPSDASRGQGRSDGTNSQGKGSGTTQGSPQKVSRETQCNLMVGNNPFDVLPVDNDAEDPLEGTSYRTVTPKKKKK